MNFFKRISVFIKTKPLLQSRASFHYTSKRFSKIDDNDFDEILNADGEYQIFSENYLKLDHTKNCYIIQPYVKWGPQKLKGITPSEQLDEAKALINTLPSWTVEDTSIVPLETLDKKTLFGSGSLEKIKRCVRTSHNVNAVFVNVGTLKKAQVLSLEQELRLPILDRYKVVMQILKMHATSKHAKLQVALAELYYLQRTTINQINFSKSDREKIKLMFQNREQKLKGAIKDLRKQRALLRSRREKIDYPVIAVVGYTNAGKTSLIKALTGEERLRPMNQLFATLDVTLHSGLLPSSLEVLYVDTVGFISDIPTNLIECFVATLEDAVLADIILHVEDISSTCFEFKRKHVLNTLQDLTIKAGATDIMQKIVSVGNKCDLASQDKDFGIIKVSSKTNQGLESLREMLEDKILVATNRRNLKIRVPVGGDEIRWLYKNGTVVSESPDENDTQFVLAQVIITNGRLQQFKHLFV